MSTTSQKPDYTREVRFAVVMYGGVSLAIYINGIAQELLRMVRATAPSRNNNATVTGTERVYRKVSYLLAQQYNDGDSSAYGFTDESVADPLKVPPVRLVVDILSGTSAGGINGVFLAKALANGQDIQQLENLWIKEGAIEKLINDHKSVEPPLSKQDPPASLLNSDRMYVQLLKAFDEMDENSGKRSIEAESPLIDELDLFVTSTDLQGVVLPIRLADGLVYERRHRNVMRFVYSSPQMSGVKTRNDFHEQFNPFLAYAARCTSAFPFAFEPMILCDIDKILSKHPQYHRDTNCGSKSDLWQRFYKDYLDPRGVSTVEFPKRAFGDGGYLDNKPFSYATDMLMNRNADVPVDRKLMYIEPSPEHPEKEPEHEKKPDAIENVMAALVKLPRQESIREDLQRVKDRNRLIERVNSIAAGVDRDYFRVKPSESLNYGGEYENWKQLGALAPLPSSESWARPVLRDKEMTDFDLTDMIKRKGRGYAAYQRLRISSVTDDIARTVLRVAGFDENSDYFIIIRSLVRAWRVKKYIEYRDTPEDQRPNLNQFLFEFDLAYPLRRINYLRKKVDSLYRLEPEARQLIDIKSREWRGTGEYQPVTDEETQVLREEFLKSKAILNELFVSMRKAARSVRARRKEQSPISQLVDDLVVAINHRVKELADDPNSQSVLLDYFLGAHGDSTYKPGAAEEECEKRAYELLDKSATIREMFETTATALASHIAPVKEEAENVCYSLFTAPNTNPLSPDPRTDSLMWLARRFLGNYYNNYEDYDLLMYPLLHETEVGEADVIDIIRASPEDAIQLVDEEKAECHKLAGSGLGHFAAFLQRSWRENDILWGRLDGAERIIAALLPNHPSRTKLVGEAQAEIVCETIEDMGHNERFELLAEVMMRTKSRTAECGLLTDYVKRLLDNCAHNKDLHSRLTNLMDPTALRQFYKDNFAIQSKLDPKTTLRTAARSTTVIGKMLQSMSSEKRVNTKYALWIARLGQIFWALVEVSIPQSFLHLMWRHWLKLLYFLQVVLIIVSTLLLQQDVQRFAMTFFGITAAIHLAVVILGDYIEHKNKWLTRVKRIGLGLVVVLIVLGGLMLSTFFGADRIWHYIVASRTWSVNHPLVLWIAAAVVVVLVWLWSMRDEVKELLGEEKTP